MITLPGITIHSQLYESSASLVYRGIREQDNYAIVAKVLKQDYPSPQDLNRYRQEYEITRFLNIEGVVKAYSQQDYQRTLVILLEDFGGESLDFWMRQQLDFCPMPLPFFLNMAIAITDTLGKIHAAHVIHRDINPSNIVFNPRTGVVKIIDFSNATRFSRTNPAFKSLHLLEGTPAYLSPEQTGRMNRMLDYRTDFYSLGTTFYELLTGQLPFPTSDLLELVHCHIARPPTPPHELNATIPQPVSDLILKLMAKNAEDRYQSAWGIKADLERCAQQLAEMGQIEPMKLGLQDVSEQFHIPQKLYGREAEIEALLMAFDKVTGSQESEIQNHEQHSILHPPSSAPSCSKMMLVSGYAGIGKTALVQELHKPITTNKGYFISGKFDQFRRNIPYSAIIDALKKLVHQLLSEPEEQVEVWRSRLLTALGSNGQLIIDVIPEVELIIGKQSPIPKVGATEAQNRFNLTFQRFVRAFCAKEHPLVIFLDDLQWIDSATLKLIELILLDEQIQYLFLIGAYRGNELTPTHPVVLTLENLRNQGAVFQEITLTPLTLEPLTQLVAETLHRNPDAARSLAQVVLHKTEGNPFFVGEFLKLLHSENLLTFDAQQLSWQWNLAEIEAQDITDNVVELLLRQLQKLPEATQQVLSIAACVGSEFDLETLAIVWEKSPKAIFQDLLAAIQAGLIQPLSDLDKDLLVQEYKFLHDRVQQASYALIDESQKQVIHLQIGRNLLEKTSPEQQSDRLFEIIDHLNQGLELVTARSERTEIARLNLMAGQKAKTATAYEAAFKYFTTGLKLLNSESWQSEYDLTLSLYSEAAAVAYLQGRFDEMEQLAEVVLDRAKTVVDKVRVYNTRIQRYFSQGNLKEVLGIGLKTLQLLKIALIETPSQLDVERELGKTAALLAGREIEDLVHLPEMTELEAREAMSILATILAAAFMGAPALMILIVCRMVNLSIEYGNSPWSIRGYGAYALVLCRVAQDIELGCRFGQLALNLANRSNSKNEAVSGVYIMHWKTHLREIIPLLVDGYQSALEAGEFRSASHTAAGVCYYSFFAGYKLTEVEQKTAIYSREVRQIRQENPFNWIAVLWQTLLNLLDESENPNCLTGNVYNEELGLAYAIELKDGTGIHCFYSYKFILCYLFGEYHHAAQAVVLARQYLESVSGMIAVPLFHFYDSLVLLSLWIEASSAEQKNYLSCVTTNQKEMQRWADHAPMNFLHKLHLVEAEKARVLGQFFEAEEFYEQAISGASENDFIQEEALAYELAAKHYLARGREKIAQTYMKEAHYCYDRWGATAKVKDLENRYPQFFSQSSRTASASIPVTAETTSKPLHTAFDLAAVMKASQAISREIELKQLLRLLMQILIENAGAQTGYLILENSGKWSIEAACELNADENSCAAQVLQSIPIADQLPESIIQYVIRTLKSVILNDATREGAFITEPYIQQNQPQSVFCLPLLNQAKLVGVLYLENRLATRVFTPERHQVLQLLSTQAAIAIENAQLYAKLRTSESQITQFLEAVQVGIGVLDATGCPYYVNERGIQLLGKGVEPTASPENLSEIYQIYLSGTNQIYPTEKMPLVRALSGERTRIEDMEIHQNDKIIPVEAWGTPIFDERGNVAYAITAFQDITERKQAEKLLVDYNCTLEQQVAERTAALRQSEANYRNLLQTANSVIIRYDTQGRIHYINDYGVKLLGYEEREILGRTLFETIIPEAELSGRDVRPMVYDLLRNPQAYPQGEGENLCRDGQRVWMAWSNQAIFNDQGEIVEILSVGNDTTQRRQAEEALQRSEANYRNLIQTANSIILRMDRQGRILYINDFGLSFFGYEEDQILGRTLLETIVPETETSGRNLKQFVHDLLHKFEDSLPQAYLQIENENLCRDGKRVWISWSNQIIFNEQGEVVEILSVGNDITQRKQAEAALQASETKLRNLIEAIPDPLFVFSAEGRFLEIMVLDPNLLWHPFEEMIGRTMHQLGREEADEFLGYIQQVLRTRQILTVEYGAFLSGREMWFSARIAPISHDQVIWLVRDITAQKQAEEASILEERNRMAREIHDTLAQSFTGILAQVGAAKQVLTDDVEATGAHLDLIKELARTGLTEARRSVVALRPQLLEEGSLQSALHRLVAQTRTAAMDTTLHYEIEGAVYSLPTEVENNLLRMGQEALTNAIRHANADEIRVGLVYDRDQVCLRVRDNGQGFGVGSIPASEGFGLLGMSERAERIGAQLTIRSQPGQGTEIIVTVNP